MASGFLALPLVLGGCFADETISGYALEGAIYRLVSIDDSQVEYSVTLSFPKRGRIAGDAPCNSYSAAQNAPYLWFEVGPITATERACDALDQETAYFAALAAMTIAEVSGDLLILSNDAGRELLFLAQSALE